MSPDSTASRRRIAELQPGERVEDQVFRLAQKDLRTASNGSLYIHAVLADASGQMVARMWQASQELYDSMPEGGLLHVRGRVDSYRGNRQFIVEGLRAVEPGTFDPADFLPAGREDPGVLWDRIKAILRTIRHRDLLALVGKFVNDEEFAAAFKRAPAAVQMHHAYLGGLIEHTHSLLRLAEAVCPLYPQVSRDLVIAGIFLHDVGKVRELACVTNFEYTNEGQLLGHITQCVLWIHDKCRELERETRQPFPADVEMALKHLILAHHGKYEFGSPRLPATGEAIMVHYLDNLDAKLAMVAEAIAADTDPASDWTTYVRALESRVFKPDVMGIRRESSGSKA
ncbi:MAG: HD domain-containing protein [Planctomycetota bacterium]